ncbi:type II toxin-antitoxin system VapC family toxin [bacterium]|nr:type II toxin-antitoxin system VapC family toxin [bacterium]
MKLLLDTHVFLWSLFTPERLTEGVKAAISDESNEIWISPITVWECLILADKGRIDLQPDPHTWIRSQLRVVLPHEAPLNIEVALTSRTVDLDHDDPADRFLAATAIVYGLTLVTADDRLRKSQLIDVLPAA